MTTQVPVPGFDLVVLAASTGGVHAVGTILAALPASFPTPIVVVQHRSVGPTDGLTPVLRSRASLPVRTAASGPLREGVVVLPPRTTADVDRVGGLVLRSSPSIGSVDDLLVSASAAFGPRVVAVVLTGRLSDGAAGVRAVKRAGGRVLAQDPTDAAAAAMPSAALATGCVEHSLPLALIATALVAYTMAPGGADLLAVPAAPWARLAPPRGVPA
jgi:two-component system chemotaxis response regulator CheB